MKGPMLRREFLRLAAALAGCSATVSLISRTARAQRHPPPEAEQLTHYQLGPQIWVRWNNDLLTCYRAQPKQKYPYFYPLAGPVSGLSLTSETGLPWPHHRSLFFGCDRVNGGNFWQEDLARGQIVSKGPRVLESAKTSAVIVDECEWAVPNQPAQMQDRRKFTITVPSPGIRLLDAEIEWIAVQDVTIQKTNHALFSLRSAPDISPWGGGNLVSSEGQTGEKETFGKPARWCAFYGRRERAKDIVEGIALMDHPSNPWSPCPWFTRDYGFISPMPFNWIEQPWRMAAGKSAQLRYRVVLFSGSPKEAGLDDLFAEWAKV